MESDSVFNEEEEDCVLIDHREQQSEDFSEEIDDYQIKKSISIHHKIKNSIDSDNSNNSYNYKMKISPTSIKKGHEPAKNQTIAKI